MTTETMTPTEAPINLASIVHESEVALKEAAKAQAKAIAASQRAEAAKAEADRERHLANIRYSDALESGHEAARVKVLDAQAAARTALEVAVTTGDGNVFKLYIGWATASLDAWGVDAALSEQRGYLGRPGRDAIAPTFSFSYDIAAIVDHHVLVLQEVVIERNRDRRNAFINGGTSK